MPWKQTKPFHSVLITLARSQCPFVFSLLERRNYYYYTLLRVFHTNISWWFFTRVWVTESPQVSWTLLNYLADLCGGLYLSWFLSLSNLLSILRESFQVHQRQLVSPSPTCFIASSALEHGPDIYPSFHYLLILLCGLPEWQTRVKLDNTIR